MVLGDDSVSFEKCQDFLKLLNQIEIKHKFLSHKQIVIWWHCLNFACHIWLQTNYEWAVRNCKKWYLTKTEGLSLSMASISLEKCWDCLKLLNQIENNRKLFLHKQKSNSTTMSQALPFLKDCKIIINELYEDVKSGTWQRLRNWNSLWQVSVWKSVEIF